ncbi:MAG: YitT family protein [Bacilli bacterium]|nr:YitT family protein [Bacilli bacterium]
MDEVVETINRKKQIQRMVILFISLLLSAVLYNLLLLPLNLVVGGTGGVATITKAIYGINPALMIFLLSAACVLISFLYLGVEKTMTTIAASILYPVLVQLTSPITQFFPKDADTLLIVIFAGVLGGISAGLIYKTGYNSGGFNALTHILFEQKKISLAKSNLVINGLIVILGAFFFGANNALYAIIYLYICNIVMDKVLLGISNNKAFYIITDQEERVNDYIMRILGHTVTIFDVKGGFMEQKRRVLLTVIPSREYYKVTEGIKEIDPHVFFVVTDSYQVKGAK